MVALNQLGDSLATSESRQRDFLLSVSHELHAHDGHRWIRRSPADGVVAEEDMERWPEPCWLRRTGLDALIADLLIWPGWAPWSSLLDVSWWSTCVMSRMPQMTCGPTGARLRMHWELRARTARSGAMRPGTCGR